MVEGRVRVVATREDSGLIVVPGAGVDRHGKGSLRDRGHHRIIRVRRQRDVAGDVGRLGHRSAVRLLERRGEGQPVAGAGIAGDAFVRVGPFARHPAQRGEPLVSELGCAAGAAARATAVLRIGCAVEDKLLGELLQLARLEEPARLDGLGRGELRTRGRMRAHAHAHAHTRAHESTREHTRV